MDNFSEHLPTIFLIVICLVLSRMKSFKEILKPKKECKIPFSYEEIEVRKNWFRALTMLLLGNLIANLSLYFYVLINANLDAGNEFLLINILNVIPVAIGGAIVYGVAYINYGTRWLAFFLIVSPTKNLFHLINELNEIFSFPDLTNFQITYLLLANFLTIAVSVNYWIHCKRLYQSNRKTILNCQKVSFK